jgi:transposase-like protein
MGALACPRCGVKDVININLTLEKGERVSFYSCHRCEKRWWNKEGEAVGLDGVLDAARRAPRARRPDPSELISE